MGCLMIRAGRSGLGGHVPGYVPGFIFPKPAPIQARSGRSWRSGSGARAPDTRAQTKKPFSLSRVYTFIRYTRNTWNVHYSMRPQGVPGLKVNPEHEAQARNMSKPLRKTMPTVACWIDELRETFGAESINASIRAGIDGQPTFYARENGQEIGTRFVPDPAKTVCLADCILGPMNLPAKESHHG